MEEAERGGVVGVAAVHTGPLGRRVGFSRRLHGHPLGLCPAGTVQLDRYRVSLEVFQIKKRFGPCAFSGSTVLQCLQQHPGGSSGASAGFCRALSLLVTL